MAGTLTIRNLDDELKARLRLQAAQRGHSMEQEARDILRLALQVPADIGLAQRIRARFAGLDAHTLPIPPRRPVRQAPLLVDEEAGYRAAPASAKPAAGATKAATTRKRK